MTSNSPVRNLAVVIVLAVVFISPSLFMSREALIDTVSFLMLVYGVIGLYLIAHETWVSFWSGERDRESLALYGIFALFLSVVLMRSYGILVRNVSGLEWLEETHLYASFIFVQFIGVWLFSRASTQSVMMTKQNKWGQLIIGIIIGALVASSRVVEPVLMAIGKLFGRLF